MVVIYIVSLSIIITLDEAFILFCSAIIACNTTVTVQMGFGNSSQTWAISPDDFKLSELDEGECLGAFFELSGGGSAPPWIIGDTFLVS